MFGSPPKTPAIAELRQLRQKIIKDCRDVGENFAEEARKIHYGEAEPEGIYGQTTREEREALDDEGAGRIVSERPVVARWCRKRWRGRHVRHRRRRGWDVR